MKIINVLVILVMFFYAGCKGPPSNVSGSAHQFTPREMEWLATKLQAYCGVKSGYGTETYSIDFIEGSRRSEIVISIKCDKCPDGEAKRIDLLSDILSKIHKAKKIIELEVDRRIHRPYSEGINAYFLIKISGATFPELERFASDWNSVYEPMPGKDTEKEPCLVLPQ